VATWDGLTRVSFYGSYGYCGLTIECVRISSLPVLAQALTELDDLLIRDKQTVTRSAPTMSQAKKKSGAREPYNRTRYWQYASDRKATFSELYQFCFILAKPP
jgi:DCN1-like protein 4/5